MFINSFFNLLGVLVNFSIYLIFFISIAFIFFKVSPVFKKTVYWVAVLFFVIIYSIFTSEILAGELWKIENVATVIVKSALYVIFIISLKYLLKFLTHNWTENRKIRVALLVVVAYLSGLFFLPISIITEPMNNSLNALRPVYRYCATDNDCEVKQIDCQRCGFGSMGAATNKNYKPFCPLPSSMYDLCPDAMPSWHRVKAVCKKNVCVESKESIDKF